MLYLKQSTASQNVLIGPFLDDTDFKTEETGLTIANTDIRLSKNGGNMAAKNSGGGTHDEVGMYQITFDATDTDTVGRLQLNVSVAGALPIWHEYTVLEEAVYDALFAASATAFDASGQVTVGSIAADAITAAAIATDAIDADAIAADAIGSSELAASAANEIRDAILSDSTAFAGANIALIKTEVDKLDAAHTEPSGVPAANETPLDKLGYIYAALRNKVTATSTKKQFYNDSDTVMWEKDLSDDGSTFTETEGNAP